MPLRDPPSFTAPKDYRSVSSRYALAHRSWRQRCEPHEVLNNAVVPSVKYLQLSQAAAVLSSAAKPLCHSTPSNAALISSLFVNNDLFRSQHPALAERQTKVLLLV